MISFIIPIFLLIAFVIINKKRKKIVTNKKIKSVYNYLCWCNKNKIDWSPILRTTYQNYLLLDDQIVFLDGFSEFTEFPVCGLSANVVITIARIAYLFNYKKLDQEILKFIIYNINNCTFNVKESNNYQYYTNYEPNEYVVKICEETMMPYTYDQTTGSHWKTASEKLFGPLNSQIYAYIYYCNLVKKLNRYPTKNEFIIFIYKRMKSRGIDTLPKNIETIVDAVFISYHDIVFSLKPDVFINKFKNAIDPSNRILLERQTKIKNN